MILRIAQNACGFSKAIGQNAGIRRLISFGLIGGSTGAIQLALMYLLTGLGCNQLVAAPAALHLSVALNFVLNRYFTWSDRFVGMSAKTGIIWLLPMFLVFDLANPTVWSKTVLVDSFIHFLGFPMWAAWLVFEVVGAAVNFLGAEKVTFGCVVKLICWLDKPGNSSTKPEALLD